MDVFLAISEPTRRGILDMLAEGERPAGDFVAAFPGLTQPGVSRHLRILLTVGLVSVRPLSQKRLYSLEPKKLAELDRWLERYRGFWDGRLNALERHLDRKKASRQSKPERKPS
ncbi:MAG: regulatory protein ArsR [Fibrobacteres bacterium]|nr:regulatory protein ArsR [Fibrobacterota bacterium]